MNFLHQTQNINWNRIINRDAYASSGIVNGINLVIYKLNQDKQQVKIRDEASLPSEKKRVYTRIMVEFQGLAYFEHSLDNKKFIKDDSIYQFT